MMRLRSSLVVAAAAQTDPESTARFFLSTGRFLQADLEDESQIQLSNEAAIAWYCMAGALFVSLVSCVVWFWHREHTGHQRVLRALEREHDLEDISRMESNIQSFTDAERAKRIRVVHHALKDQFRVITKADLRRNRANSSSSSSSADKCAPGAAAHGREDHFDDGSEEGPLNACSICLEDFVEGEKVAHSSHSLCRHCFHHDCIVSWLVARQHAFCPYCRRPFVCLPTPRTSVASHDHMSSIMMDDVESSRRENSTISPLDERALAEALEAVQEHEGDDADTAEEDEKFSSNTSDETSSC